MAQDADPSHGDQDRPPILETGADTPGDTRFGPRPVPKGHRHPAGPSESRRIPPHGDVSPDGHRVWPRPSPTAKWLVWGGTALAAAAVTVGAVIAARHVLDALSDKDADRGMDVLESAAKAGSPVAHYRLAIKRMAAEKPDMLLCYGHLLVAASGGVFRYSTTVGSIPD